MNLDVFKGSQQGPAYVLGNGPSLDTIDFARLKYPTVGVNRSWRKILSVWHCIAANDHYFREITRGKWKPKYVFIAGRLSDHVRTFMRLAVPGICIDYDEMLVDVEQLANYHHAYPGINFALTGILALQVTWYLGFNPIYLIGFDGGNSGHFKTNERAGHFADSRNQKPSYQDHNPYHQNVANALTPDIRVFNCNPDSQITVWPYKEVPYQQ